MANNYYEATGLLSLERVTPVIVALFGAFHLDANYPGSGRAYIARIAETNDPQWDDVLEGLTGLAEQLGISPNAEAEATIVVVLENWPHTSMPIRTKLSKTCLSIIRSKEMQTLKSCSSSHLASTMAITLSLFSSRVAGIAASRGCSSLVVTHASSAGRSPCSATRPRC